MNGWEGLKAKEQKAPKPTKEEIAIAKIFTNEDGKTALEYLKKLTIERPTFEQVAHDGMLTSQLMFLREGENNLFRKITQIINKVNNDRK